MNPNAAEQDGTGAGDLGGFGPFDPPSTYTFEPELQDRPPRPMPTFERPGRLERSRRRAFTGFFTAGVVCLILAPIPLVQRMGLYFLPLAWLAWIGAGCIVVAVGSLASRFITRGPYRYVQEGVPVIARIAAIIKTPTAVMNGEPTQHAFVAAIEYRDPDTRQLRSAEVRSNQFSSAMKDTYTTSYRVGDYATALYLPHRPETIQLYGFLDLNPGVGLQRRGATFERGDIWQVPLLIGAIAGFFAVLFWNVYAIGRFEPINFDYWQAAIPMTIGGLLLGGGMLLLLFAEHRHRMRKIESHNRAAAASGEAIEIGTSLVGSRSMSGWLLKAILVPGALLLGAATTLCWCFTYNALADNSPPHSRPVYIKEFWETTHGGIFRDYSIEYSFEHGGPTQKLMSDPDHMARFELPLGLAEVHDGRLGWEWVKDIRPLEPVEEPAP